MRKLNYVDGFTIFNCRRVAKYAFADFYLKAEKNLEEMCFEVYVRTELPDGSKLDKDSIDYFKDCFQFRVIPFKNSEEYDSY